MALPEDGRHALITFQRFGFGAKARDAAAIGRDPVGALREEVARGMVARPSGPDLLTTAEAFEELDEFRTARQRARAVQAAQNTPRVQNIPPAQNTPPAMANPPAVAAEVKPGEMPPPAAKPAPQPPPPPQRIFRSEAKARLEAAIDAPIGFGERLVWFWANHFAVSVAKDQPTRVAAGTMEREAIRPHVFGRFADMLLAVESHPAMLFYLDNRQSIGPNSRAGERRGKGLNENLARETLELHTLGVQGGYTQADVTNLAKMITGWTVIGPNDEDGILGNFYFNENRHEPGPQALLGKTYTQEGQDQGEAALHDLARHPATAGHLAFKLAKHFVADDPPPALVKRLTEVYRASDGDLKAIAMALIEAPESWSMPPAKLRSPQEFVVAAQRATDVKFNDGLMLNAFNGLGQPLWQPPGPNGFADTMAQWATPEGMKTRLDVAALFAKQTNNAINPSELADALYGAALSTETRTAIARAETKQQGIALLLMAPEFQRR